MSAAALSLLLATFSSGQGRDRAIGVWAAVSAAGGATGFLLGGVLVAGFGWRSVFAVNVPIGAAIVILASRFLTHDPARPRQGAIDLAGAAVLTAGIAGGAFALVDGGRIGYDSVAVWVLMLASAALLVAFWTIERRAADPLVPPEVLRSAPVMLANLVAALITMAVTPMFFFLTLYVQDVLGLSPLAAAMSILPLSVVIAMGASRAPHAVARWGTQRTLAAGLALLTVGLWQYSRLPLAAAIVPDVLLPSLVAGVGAGMVWVAATSAATAHADDADAGLYAGLVSTAQQLGSVIGLAMLSAVAATVAGPTETPSTMAEGLRAGFFGGGVLTSVAALITMVSIVLAASSAHSPPTRRTARREPPRPGGPAPLRSGGCQGHGPTLDLVVEPLRRSGSGREGCGRRVKCGLFRFSACSSIQRSRASPRREPPGRSCPQTWCNSGDAVNESGHRVILASLD